MARAILGLIRSGAAAGLLSAAALLAQPVSHPGWPVTYKTTSATFVEETSIQVGDIFGDGSRTAVISWFARINSTTFPGAVEIRGGDGTVLRRFDYNRIAYSPAFVDRDDDGAYEIVTGRGTGISMFDANGNLLWDRPRINTDPVWKYLSLARPSIGDLDGDGKQWIAVTTQGYAIYVLDLDGNPRAGWPIPLTPGNVMNATPTLIDLDGDGKLEVLAGDSHGHIFCYHGDGTACNGWPYVYQPGGNTAITFDLSPVIAFTGNDGYPYIAAVSDYIGPPAAIHVIDRFGQPVPPYPIGFPGTTGGESYSLFEASGTKWLAEGDHAGNNYMFDLATGISASGWPVHNGTAQFFTCAPVIGNLGQIGAAGLLFAGQDNSISRNEGYDNSGTHLLGYPRTISKVDDVNTISLSTLDGLTTTACWATGTSSGNSGIADCFDVGVPWSRNNVQWGNYGFDLQHTSRFRRLWQIDRNNTCVTIPAPELPTTGATFDVTICPRDASNITLGPDQELRFARRPILGQFTGPIVYEPATGNYHRTYQAPIQDDGADVEFRVLVNEELDDTMPIVHLRGKPKITTFNPDGVPWGGFATTISLSGIDFSSTPTVTATTSELTVVSFTVTGTNAINVNARATSSTFTGWSGLQVISSDGRISNVVQVFIYDPSYVTLIGRRPGVTSDAALEWFGNLGGPGFWTLERSDDPSFFPASTTQLYQGAARTYTDPTPATPLWFYHVY